MPFFLPASVSPATPVSFSLMGRPTPRTKASQEAIERVKERKICLSPPFLWIGGQAGAPGQVPSLGPCKATPKLVNNSHTQEPLRVPQRAAASKQVDGSQNPWRAHGAWGAPWPVSLRSACSMPTVCPVRCCDLTRYSAPLGELRAITTLPLPLQGHWPVSPAWGPQIVGGASSGI